MNFSPTYYPSIRAVAKKSNGNNLIAIHQRHNTGQGLAGLAEITMNGDTVWFRPFSRTSSYGENYITFIKELPNKQIFMAGGTHSSDNWHHGAVWLADSLGNVLMYKQIAYNTCRMVTINDADMAADGSIYWAGHYYDIYSGGVTFYSWTVPLYGKLNSDLTFAWTKTWGSTNHTNSNNNRGSVYCLKATGNEIIVAGVDAVDVGHGYLGTLQLAKVSSGGTTVWRKQRALTGYSTPTAMTIAPGGTIYLFSKLYTGTPFGGEDILLEKFTSSGSPVWSKTYGTSQAEHLYRAKFNSSNNQIVAVGDLYFSGGAETKAWISILDTSGVMLQNRLFGEPSTNNNSLLDVDILSNNYFAGGSAYTYGAMLVQADWSGNTGCTPVEPTLLNGSTTHTYSTGITHNSIAMTQSTELTSYYHPALTAATTCYTCSNVTTNQSIQACGSYYIGGGLQTSSGIFHDTLQAQSGCDSIIVTNLTIYQPPSAAYAGQDQHICTNAAAISATPPAVGSGHWMWVSGSGTSVNANLPGTGINGLAADTNILSWTVCNGSCTPTYDEVMIIAGRPSSSYTNASACSSYTFNGLTYDTAGVYLQTLTNAENCDSTITLNLTISPVYAFSEYSSICDGDTLQWHGVNYTATGTYNAN